jgi:predicted dehydrogenase
MEGTMSSQPKRVRYAVVGAGNIAQAAVLPAFANAKENSELVAVLSNDPEKRSALAKRYSLEATGTYDELEQVLQRARVDAVYIATPNSTHRALTERAARAGVHVLCEKPMADTVEDCQAMIDVCKRHDVRLMIAYRLHFEESTLRAIDLVHAGTIGEPRLFSGVFTQQVRRDDIRTAKSLSGGALLDMGVYPINAARYLFRSEPYEVFAAVSGSDPKLAAVDETTSVFLRFPGERVAQLSASIGAASVDSCRIIGTLGDLRLEPAFAFGQPLVHHLTVGGKTSEQTFKAGDQFAPELLAFSQSVLDKSEPEPSGEEGLMDVRIVKAAQESARTGQVVALARRERDRYPTLSQRIVKPAVKVPPLVNAPPPTMK